MTVVELVVVLAILTIAMGMFAQTLASSARLDPVSTETSIAAEAARVQIERMRNRPFDEVYALYNADPADDPGGAGTAPGNRFTVPGLAPLVADGFVGEVQFPEIGGELREDVADDMFGMPRDLNGDELVDGGDHSADRIILPLRIRIEWATRSGKGGRRSFAMYTMFADL